MLTAEDLLAAKITSVWQLDDKLEKVSLEGYREQLENLQIQALAIQQACYRQNRRAIVVFEGWDAAGKGGSIARLTEKMDPRGFFVHLVGPPHAHEQAKHYLFRFWKKIPKPGTIAIFDRSWYGRVLVERVNDLCSKSTWQRAYEEINTFEKTLQAEGVIFVKFFLHISKQEQLQRLHNRYLDPLKAWKLTVDDFANLAARSAYEKAIDDMLKNCQTVAPWHVIKAGRKKPARLQILRILIETLSRHCDLSLPALDEDVRVLAEKTFGATHSQS